MKEKLNLVRKFMLDSDTDAWLIIDFRGIDPTGEALLGNLAPQSRLYAILITPKEPILIIKSPVDGNALLELDSSIQTIDVRTQSAFMMALKEHTKQFNRVALNFGENPQTDVLPTGRFVYLREANPHVTWVSGENFMQIIHSMLSKKQIASHKRAAKTLTKIMNQAFDFIKDQVGLITEIQVADFLQGLLSESQLTFVDGPMVAVQANTANPHYTPRMVKIKKNQVLMIDLWAKWDIFADITWMAYTGTHIPDELHQVWDVILTARKAATTAIKPYSSAKIPDEVARNVMIDAGFKDAILHRTGHSIDSRSHGKGANLDSYEMPETRLLLPNTLTSVEPGIYLKERFGVRSEINVLVTESSYQVTTPPQEKLLCL